MYKGNFLHREWVKGGNYLFNCSFILRNSCYYILEILSLVTSWRKSNNTIRSCAYARSLLQKLLAVFVRHDWCVDWSFGEWVKSIGVFFGGGLMFRLCEGDWSGRGSLENVLLTFYCRSASLVVCNMYDRSSTQACLTTKGAHLPVSRFILGYVVQHFRKFLCIMLIVYFR